VILVLLSRLLDWRSILVVVQPDTLIRWHRQGWRLFWRWKSRPRTAADSQGLAATHRAHGAFESHLGRGKDWVRIAPQIGADGVIAHGRSVSSAPAKLGTQDALHLATAVLWREMSRTDLVMAMHDTALGMAPRAHGLPVVGISR
jgi:hypothetical protein